VQLNWLSLTFDRLSTRNDDAVGHVMNEKNNVTVVLGPEQIARFHENGFLSIPHISTPAEVALLRGVFDRLFAENAGRVEGAQYDIAGHDDDDATQALPTIINPINYAAELKHTLFRKNAHAIALQLLGPKVTPSFEHVILKPGRYGEATPWHQDEAYRVDPNFEYQQVSIWMPLQDVTIDNGCMQYIPGSHKLGILPHRSPNDDPRIHAIECIGGFDPATAIACEMSAGGATMHIGKALHYAGPNKSDVARYGYILAFEVPPKPRAEQRDFYWNREKEAANFARRREWRRKGGIFIEALRKIRNGLLRSPGRVAFEFRRALHAMFSQR